MCGIWFSSKKTSNLAHAVAYIVRIAMRSLTSILLTVLHWAGYNFSLHSYIYSKIPLLFFA